ncbi:hypothetical protein JHK87_052582 [Glycine soja]|nr:hypothetical protein JHK87_052582 [Glycine soja]
MATSLWIMDRAFELMQRSDIIIQGLTILAPVDSPNTDGIDPGCKMWYLWCQFCIMDYEHAGVGAIEFIICHSEVSIALAEEKKIPEDQTQSFELPIKKRMYTCLTFHSHILFLGPLRRYSYGMVLQLVSGVGFDTEDFFWGLLEEDIKERQ